MRIDAGSTPFTASSTASAGAVAGAARVSTLDVTIATRDGDTIAISASRTTALGIAAAGTEGSVGATIVQSTSSSVNVSVEGSLEHDELVDLKKVLKVLDHAARRRDAQRLLHRLTRPDLDSVTSVEATFETSTAAVVTAGSL